MHSGKVISFSIFYEHDVFIGKGNSVPRGHGVPRELDMKVLGVHGALFLCSKSKIFIAFFPNT